MARRYTMTRRAERQAETRLRIVEATIALHGSIGASQTTLSMVAERAGVQRHTLYAHFPDEHSLNLACSGLQLERDPLPDAAAIAVIADPRERLRAGLRALYGWYERNAGIAGCAVRDAEFHEPTQRIVALRIAPPMGALAGTLAAVLPPHRIPMLRLMLGYHAWRSLAQESGLPPDVVVETAASAIEGCP
jgi:AcrR family transcriptional regulator